MAALGWSEVLLQTFDPAHGPFGKAVTQIIFFLLPDFTFKLFEALDASVEIVGAHRKIFLTSVTENPLEGLWFHLNLIEDLLFILASTIWRVPITPIVLGESFLPCHAPVSRFMKGRPKIISSELDLTISLGRRSAIERLRVTSPQTSLVVMVEDAVEKIANLFNSPIEQVLLRTEGHIAPTPT